MGTYTAARWWLALAFEFACLLTPGPQRSLFSGAPLSSRAAALFLGVVILAVFSMFYPPTRRVRFRWLAALAVLVALKLALASMLIDTGWRAEYWTPVEWRESASILHQAQFVTRRDLERRANQDKLGVFFGLQSHRRLAAMRDS